MWRALQQLFLALGAPEMLVVGAGVDPATSHFSGAFL
jgi:hypothetical protein